MSLQVRPLVLTPVSSPLIQVLGGIVATVLASAIIYSAPLAGAPLVDYPRLVGGVVFATPDRAFWGGYILMFVGGSLVIPLLAFASWSLLPGDPLKFGGVLLKGLSIGVLLWLLTGVLVGLASQVNRLAAPVEGVLLPGWFALPAGTGAAALLLVAVLAYGLGLPLIAQMEQGITTIDVLGWDGYSHGAGSSVLLGEHRSDRTPTAPDGGERPWRAPR